MPGTTQQKQLLEQEAYFFMFNAAIRTVSASQVSTLLTSGLAKRQETHVMISIHKKEEQHCAQHAGNKHVRARNGTIAPPFAAIATTVPPTMFSNASTVGVLSAPYHPAASIATIARSAYIQNMSMFIPVIA
jgi:hypothetical protein